MAPAFGVVRWHWLRPWDGGHCLFPGGVVAVCERPAPAGGGAGTPHAGSTRTPSPGRHGDAGRTMSARRGRSGATARRASGCLRFAPLRRWGTTRSKIWRCAPPRRPTPPETPGRTPASATVWPATPSCSWSCGGSWAMTLWLERAVEFGDAADGLPRGGAGRGSVAGRRAGQLQPRLHDGIGRAWALLPAIGSSRSG